jgi:ATP-dependent Clp protease ATP-binding subunit ClpC
MLTYRRMPQTPPAKKVIEYAMEEARNLNHNYVGTEHLLLGLLREQEGVAAQVLMNFGVRLQEVRNEVDKLTVRETEAPDPRQSDSQFGPGAWAVSSGKSPGPLASVTVPQTVQTSFQST